MLLYKPIINSIKIADWDITHACDQAGLCDLTINVPVTEDLFISFTTAFLSQPFPYFNYASFDNSLQ